MAIIDGSYGFGNLGDELILTSMIRILTSLGLDAVAVSFDPEDTRTRHKIPAIRKPKRLSGAMALPSLARYFKGVRSHLPACRLYVIGGGSVLSDERGAGGLLRMFCVVHLLKGLWKKKLALLGVSIGPLHSALGRFAVRTIVQKADLVYTRDSNSRDFVLGSGSEARVISGQDLAFSLQSHHSPLRGHALAVAVRDHPPTAERGTGLGRREMYLSNLARLLERFHLETGSPIVLIAMQHGGTRSARMDDLDFAQKLSKLVGAARIAICVPDDFSALGDALKQGKLLLGERYHALVAALLSGVPFVPICYHEKSTALIEDLEFNGPTLSTGEVEDDPEKCYSILMEAWSASDSLAEKQNRRRQDVVGRSLRDVESLKSALQELLLTTPAN